MSEDATDEPVHGNLINFVPKKQRNGDENFLIATQFPDNGALIEQLDDYSLLEIFSRLEPRDKIMIERVSKRWQRLALSSWSNVESLRQSSYRREPEIFKECLKRGCQFIEDLELTLASEFESVLIETDNKIGESGYLSDSLFAGFLISMKLIPRLLDLKKLKKLTITDFRSYLNILLYLPAFMEKIEFVQPSYVGKSSLCKQDYSGFRNLQHLTINGVKIRDNIIRGLENMKNMKHLDFSDCKLRFDVLMSIRNWNQLEYLAIPNAYIMDDLLIEVVTNNQQLKHLDISNPTRKLRDETYGSISSLYSLESLLIKKSGAITLKFMNFLPNLRKLDCSFCFKINDEQLLRIIKCAPKLEHLNINACNVHECFLKNLSAFLQKHGERPAIITCVTRSIRSENYERVIMAKYSESVSEYYRDSSVSEYEEYYYLDSSDSDDFYRCLMNDPAFM